MSEKQTPKTYDAAKRYCVALCQALGNVGSIES